MLDLIKQSSPENPKFSILIPTWNNLDYLKLCLKSIHKNSYYKHQILIHANEATDGSLEWLKGQEIFLTHSNNNIGICWALNGLRSHINTDYIVYMNDDMYVCQNWDLELWNEIKQLPDNKFFLSSTLLQPRPFFCKSVIAPANYGETIQSFDEEKLLLENKSFEHPDWKGATWPVNIVHKEIWDLVGGYSIEFSPGMYSDPDFSAKLWMAGVRYFKGISKSRVYHFESISTKKAKKNQGSKQFLSKWGITSSTFMKSILYRGEPWETTEKRSLLLIMNIKRSRIKRLFQALSKRGNLKDLWEN